MKQTAVSALAIGGSAGSLPVIRELLAALAPRVELAVVVCVHTGARDARGLCNMLNTHCALPIIEAEDGAPVAGATVYVAAGDYHLLVERGHTFALCAGERVHYARPSIDVLFETMAEAYQGRLTGILLSGANDDGALGLRRIHDCGGRTWIQRPDTATARDMPEAALGLFTPDQQSTPEQLAAAVAQLSRPARVRG